MASDPYKRVFTAILDAFERFAYLAIALALSVPIVLLVVSAAMSMLEVAEVGVLETVLAVLDRLLLAFIFVELIDTIKVTLTERGIFIAEPFLLVGLIAVVRRILLLTAGLEQAEKHGNVSKHAHGAGGDDWAGDRVDNCAVLEPSHASL